MSAAKSKSFDPQVIAKTCMNVVESSLQKMGNLTFTQPPEFSERKIIEYHSRMRVFGMEIFNGPCYISYVNFYLSESHVKAKNPIAAFVFYVEEENAAKIFKALGYKGFNEHEETTMLDTCGELCNMLAGNFKKEIAQLGYQDLVMSAPVSHYNSVPDGVDFHYDQYVKFETSFYLWKQKLLAIDVTMGLIPGKK